MSASPDFDNMALWDVRKDVVVFDEHCRPEKVLPDGRKIPAREFKKPDLEAIARNSNERDAKGLPCALVIGHTTDDADEKSQPEIVGYERHFRVEFDRRLGKNVIKADHYLRRDKAKEAEQYPRISVEHWINQDFLDPIALVKRTPKLDIPQWHYTRRRGELVQRYTMETDMPADPTSAPDAAAPNPELEAMVMKCVMACLEKMKMTAGGMGQPSPTNAAMPGAAPYTAPNGNSDVERFASEAERIRYTRQQTEIEQLKKDRAGDLERFARVECEGYVKGLIRDGIEVYAADGKPIPDEALIQRFVKLGSVEARSQWDGEIRANWNRPPVGDERDMIRTYEPNPAERNRRDRGPDEVTERETDLAVRHMRKTHDNDFNKALKYVRERKTA